MITKIDGFALVYEPVVETPVMTDGRKCYRFFGSARKTVVQANDLPDELQEAIMRFLETQHPNVRFGKKKCEPEPETRG